VEAVLGLHAAPPAEPSWSSPVSAKAAEALLDVCCEDLREGSQTHRAVYAQFTERIWEVPVRRLQHGRRPWRLIARFRLQRAFAASSRTEKTPSSLSEAADLVLEAHAVRDRLSTVAPLLASHLGRYDRGPLTDVDAIRTSLAAVRDLQHALGDLLNADRVARLLTAGAFNDDAVLEPARALSAELHAWNAKVVALGGGRTVAMDATELVRWASLVEEALPAAEIAVTAVGRPGGSGATLRDLAYNLLVRERREEPIVPAPSSPATATTTAAGTAS
jgi:hypothetical protein